MCLLIYRSIYLIGIIRARHDLPTSTASRSRGNGDRYNVDNTNRGSNPNTSRGKIQAWEVVNSEATPVQTVPRTYRHGSPAPNSSRGSNGDRGGVGNVQGKSVASLNTINSDRSFNSNQRYVDK